VTLRIAIANAVFCSLAAALYASTGAEPSPAIAWWIGAGPLLMVLLWVYRDARRRHVADVTDLGFFLLFFWPVALPWYAFRSRGWRGWRLLLGLAAMVLAPLLTALLVSALRG
jgi:hypothetical protein